MTKLSCRFLALSAATLLACAPAHAEFIMPIGDSDTARLSFSGTGYVAYEDRSEYTTLNGGTNAGYERLRFLANVRLQFAYGDIGQAVWSEANVNARVNKIDPVNGADSTLDIIVGNTNETSYGGLNAVLGTGNFYGLVANGGVIMHGPGAGHTGSFPRSAAGTGFYDTFQRLHGNVSGRDDDVLVTGDPSGGTLAQITEDRGGSNSDIFLGFGHVSNDHHYGV